MNKICEKINIDLKDAVVGGTVILYILGYLITSVYLGSLGVVNPDVLRSRYIVSGLLFAFYLLVIGIPLIELSKMLRDSSEVGKKLGALVRVSITTLAIISVFTLLMLGVFGFNTLPIGIPGYTDPVSSLDGTRIIQIAIDSLDSLKSLVLLVGLIYGVGIFSFLLDEVIKSIQEKDVKKIQLGELIELVKETLNYIRNPRFYSPAILLIVVFFLMYFLGYYSGGESTFVIERGLNWYRYLIITSLVFVVLAMLITLGSVIEIQNWWEKKGNGDSQNPSPSIIGVINRNYTRIYWLTAFIALAISYYALRIYPFIPQQIGGGRIVEVRLNVKDDNTINGGLESLQRLFLLDRTSKSFIIMGLGEEGELNIMEISDSEVLSIIYIQQIIKRELE